MAIMQHQTFRTYSAETQPEEASTSRTLPSRGRFGDAIRRALQHWAHRREEARNHRALLHLDDHLLADIGLDRAAAESLSRRRSSGGARR